MNQYQYRFITSALMNLLVVLTVTQAAIQDFRVPKGCKPTNAFDERFLLGTSTVKTRSQCARACAQDDKCRSLTTSEDHPNVECKLFKQSTNVFGAQLTPNNSVHYLEKFPMHARPNSCRGPRTDVPEGECSRTTTGIWVGEILVKGEIFCRWLGERKAFIQEDGNFVIVKTSDGSVLWSTGLTGFDGQLVTLQEDGNLVLQDGNGNIGWSSNSPHPNPGGAFLEIKMVIRNVNNEVSWSSA